MAGNCHDSERRPITTREKSVWQRFAQRLAKLGISPNTISIVGMVFGVAGGAVFAMTSHINMDFVRWGWLAGAVLAQLRLLANMLDGMVAIESGRSSKLGELYNEIPDRISDIAVLVGFGYAVMSEPTLGWLAACMALLVAYTRAQGKAAGARHEFCGPMAKPHRMFLITLAALYMALTPSGWHGDDHWTAPKVTLIIIAAGCAITFVRRLRRIAHALAETP